MKDLNVVIINYYCKDDIINALDSLVRDIRVSLYDIQLTVVDNSQNRDHMYEALLERFPRVKYIACVKNIGFGRANTIGFRATPARYYFALNRDTIIPKDTNVVDRLIRFLDEHKNIGCIGPKLLNTDGTLQYSCYRFDLPSLLIKPLKQLALHKKHKWIRKYVDRLNMHGFDHEKTQPVDWVLGAAMVVRQEVIDDIGWFDDRFFMYMEDCDWCRRMWDASWPVYYVHDIVIYHRYERESAKVPGVIKALVKNKLARIHLKSWFQYLWKWRGTHKQYAHLP